MPKSFSDHERAIIKKRLMDEAESCLSQYGVRKTTVEELVRRANIPKGTFYLFYDTKELLFYDVFNRFHDEMHERYLAEIDEMDNAITPQQLTDFIFRIFKETKESFFLKFMTSGEMELLIRKLPPELAQAQVEKDDFSIEKLLHLIPNIKVENYKVMRTALRAVFMAMLHEQEIGPDVFDDALKILIRGVVCQMFMEE
jgi:AcrR family transcriptional regulator